MSTHGGRGLPRLELTPGASTFREGDRAVFDGEVVFVALRTHGRGADRGNGQSEDLAAVPGDVLCAHVMRDADGARVSVIGEDLPRVQVGCRVQVRGAWEDDHQYGWQVRASLVRCSLPREADAVARYLEANVDKCGPASAERIVRELGVRCLDAIARDPGCVVGLFPGAIGLRLAAACAEWARAARESRHAWHLSLRLLEQGLTYAEVRLVHRYFREADVAAVAARHHPYRLLLAPGMRWNRIDAIARKLGYGSESPERLEAAVLHAVRQLMGVGHSAVPPSLLAGVAAEIARLPDGGEGAAVMQAVRAAADDGLLVEQGGVVASVDVWEHERSVARRVVDLTLVPRTLGPEERDAVGAVINGSALEPAQQAAVWMALAQGTSVLTGGPGTGKTTALRAVAACCRALGWPVRIVAPTGKAAARAKAVTGLDAGTLHRLLAAGPITARMLVVDEASMCGLEDADRLLSAVDPQLTAVLWSGDANQLPSVPHGAVLRDLLASGAVPATRLTEVRRAARTSRIVTNAKRLLDREPIDLRGGVGDDWRFYDLAAARGGPGAEAERAWAHLGEVIALAGSREALRRGEVQVMTPQRGGSLGVDALNARLQRTCTPDGRVGPDIGGDVFVRVGDRVIVTRNVYDLPDGALYNGEQGVVVDASVQGRGVTLRLDDAGGAERVVEMAGVQRKYLRLAWAVTVHRAQGSEYPHAVLVLHDRAHQHMLTTDIFYTAMTRARRCFHLIGTARAVRACEADEGRATRHTGLANHLRRAADGDLPAGVRSAGQ